MKAVSTIVAVLLLLIITIALAGTAFTYISGVITTRTAVVLSLDPDGQTCIGDQLIITVRNDGSASAGTVTVTARTPIGARWIGNTCTATVGVQTTGTCTITRAGGLSTGSYSLQATGGGDTTLGNVFCGTSLPFKNEGIAIKDEVGRTWWIKSNGDGTFAPKIFIGQPAGSVGCQHGAIDLNDYNNDGYLDIIIGARLADGLARLFRAFANADGTFQSFVDLGVYWSAFAACNMDFTSADFDKDGDIDLIVDGEWHVARFYRNRGDGSFDTPVDLSYVGGGERGRDVGDFNSDGKLDFMVAKCCPGTIADGRDIGGAVYLQLGNGDGSFGAQTFRFDTGDDPYTLAAGDFDNDGKADIVASFGWDARHFFYRGNGDGTFQPSVLIFDMADNGYGAGDAFDFNHDGNLDLVVNNWCNVRTYFARGLGNGQFAAPVQIADTIGFSCTMAIAAPPIY